MNGRLNGGRGCTATTRAPWYGVAHGPGSMAQDPWPRQPSVPDPALPYRHVRRFLGNGKLFEKCKKNRFLRFRLLLLMKSKHVPPPPPQSNASESPKAIPSPKAKIRIRTWGQRRKLTQNSLKTGNPRGRGGNSLKTHSKREIHKVQRIENIKI